MATIRHDEEKWFLVYDYDIYSQRRVLLKATTNDSAVIEAKAEWANILSQAKIKWARQKETWAMAPTTAFGGADPNPRLVRELPLQ